MSRPLLDGIPLIDAHVSAALLPTLEMPLEEWTGPTATATSTSNGLARKMIFGTDWPGVPSPNTNARAVAILGLTEETLAAIFRENATRIYGLERTAEGAQG